MLNTSSVAMVYLRTGIRQTRKKPRTRRGIGCAVGGAYPALAPPYAPSVAMATNSRKQVSKPRRVLADNFPRRGPTEPVTRHQPYRIAAPMGGQCVPQSAASGMITASSFTSVYAQK